MRACATKAWGGLRVGPAVAPAIGCVCRACVQSQAVPTATAAQRFLGPSRVADGIGHGLRQVLDARLADARHADAAVERHVATGCVGARRSCTGASVQLGLGASSRRTAAGWRAGCKLASVGRCRLRAPRLQLVHKAATLPEHCTPFQGRPTHMCHLSRRKRHCSLVSPVYENMPI